MTFARRALCLALGGANFREPMVVVFSVNCTLFCTRYGALYCSVQCRWELAVLLIECSFMTVQPLEATHVYSATL